MRSWFHFRPNGKAKVFAALLLLLIGLGSLNAQNISLVGSNKPPQASSGYGDVWAEGNIACMGVWTAYNTYGLGVYDISNPASPTLLTVHNFGSGPGNQFEQGVIRNKILYVASWGNGSSGSGLHILSLTNPAAPLLLSRITKSSLGTVTNGFDAVHTMWLERNYLYEAAHVSGSVSVKVFDVSNPFLPVYLQDVVTTNTTKVHQITTGTKGTNTILYTSGWGGGSSFGQTDIWDVSNVGTQPAQWLGRAYSGSSSHSSWPTPDGNTLVVCRETSGGEVSLYDISTPPNPSSSTTANPAPIAVISPARMGIEASIPHNPVIVGNLLFLSWYQNGLQIFDIADRTKPVRVGSFDTYAPAGTSGFQGAWGVYPQLGLDKILVSDIHNGFLILNASAVLTGTNNYPPLLVQNPASQTVDQGSNVVFASIVTGSSLNYQWRFNGTNVSGATGSSHAIGNVQGNQAGSYSVLANNSFGAVTSAVANLSVNLTSSAPGISAQPQDISVYPEQSATFSVAVTGGAPLSFQWRFNGDDIPGATNGTLIRPNVQGEQVGAYSVFISNGAGATTSSNAFLTLIDSPYINGVQSVAGARSALISWNTTIPGDSLVQFDPAGAINQSQLAAFSSTASFSTSSYRDRTLATNHTILLTGLSPGMLYNFQVISKAGTNNYISGVYQFTTAGGPIILDNTNSAVTFTNTWSTSTNVVGYFGSNYRWANVSATTLRTATFKPNLPTAGKYDVSVWYTASTDRATNAPFTISYSGGSVTVPVNQKINGGQWVPLASGLSFAAGTGGFVRLANNASGGTVVIADAVRFVYSEAQDFPTDGGVPDWWSNFYFSGATNPALDPDGDGYTTAQEYIMGTSPVAPGQHLAVDVFRSGQSANIIFSPFLGNRNYALLHRPDLLSGSWQPYPTGSIVPNAYGEGAFPFSITNALQGYFRLSVQLTTNGAAFSGSLATPKSQAFSAYATDPICGPNRAYVK